MLSCFGGLAAYSAGAYFDTRCSYASTSHGIERYKVPKSVDRIGCGRRTAPAPAALGSCALRRDVCEHVRLNVCLQEQRGSFGAAIMLNAGTWWGGS